MNDDQLLRYSRHILLDDVGIEGQQRLVDSHVLVVGGGDSALEAAASIAEQAGSQVILSYRGSTYGRAKRANRERVSQLIAAGRIDEWLESTIAGIGEDHIEIARDNTVHRLANDAVIICAGGLLPNQFLRDVGVAVETKFGTV